MFAFLTHTVILRPRSPCNSYRSRPLTTHCATSLPIPKVAPKTSPCTRYHTHNLAAVILSRGKARLLRETQTTAVYPSAIASISPIPHAPLRPSDPVAVLDGAHNLLALGFYNPFSLYRVRILHHAPPNNSLPWQIPARIAAIIADAIALRTVLGLPAPDTTAYRVVNADADALPGLVVDRLGATLVVSPSAHWAQTHAATIRTALETAFPDAHLVWRPAEARLRQDGWEGDLPAAPVPTGDVTAVESGIRFALPLSAIVAGQKTGHYADHRENRAYVRDLVSRTGMRRVLDLYCYSGLFAISAALGGATTVTGVDSSESAVSIAKENAVRNGVEGTTKFVESDVGPFMKAERDLGNEYDLIIVDPPKFAPGRKSLHRAKYKYAAVNSAAASLVAPGGLLLTCSCSAAMTTPLFTEVILHAIRAAGRVPTLLATRGAAPDHPSGEAGAYLTALLLCVR